MTSATISMKFRFLYLSCLGTIQLIAYWSYYIQFPGLLSSSGIDPVERIFHYAAPSFYENLVKPGIVDESSLCELMALLGMILSAFIASGVCQHGSLFALNAAIYSLLVRTGGTFYSFQWDTLLLEVTAITCLVYAPWIPTSAQRLADERTSLSPVAPIPLRFLLFKLMFMSGVVKLQARCPTWEHLTALEYHFATQCLPGPLAWWAHQLPPLLLRVGVAATLWIEIPAAFLLVVPFSGARKVGAMLQITLQLLIILTGNYNFFNLLTMVLCIPVWETRPKSDIQIKSIWEFSLFGTFLLWTVHSMFRLEFAAADNHLNILLKQVSIWLQPHTYLPLIPYGTLMMVALVSLSTKSIPRIIHGMVCFWVIVTVAIPLDQIRSGGTSMFPPIAARFHRSWFQPYWLVNGYGLFRRMTGVGTVPTSSKGGGWAGLPPSAVARPEIILEGLFENATPSIEDDWQELHIFRWKPGAVDVIPKQMAPHQPRLDWQMWFAALGNIQHNPWLVHLIYKLLTECEPVLDLVGADATAVSKLSRIRATLYHYDFTRLNTTWSRTIPGIETVRLSNKTVWTRTMVGMYLPPVESEDLENYLRSNGFTTVCEEQCSRHRNRWCTLTRAIRRFRMYLLIPLSLVLWLGRYVLWTRTGDDRLVIPNRECKSKEKLEEKKIQ